jgi:hypothetical protein
MPSEGEKEHERANQGNRGQAREDKRGQGVGLAGQTGSVHFECCRIRASPRAARAGSGTAHAYSILSVSEKIPREHRKARESMRGHNGDRGAKEAKGLWQLSTGKIK